ncbi:hypothetical protein VIGAN_04375000 [Vigna angularis var. angularis]|uniref:Uncharacterized protein n=1 Tax=Vigna angularis var. angularis TaxID=157739 RepID=A0A0S3S018_PHAAN|nr:hypothetical protein VIGAN_04375000 [Vigna angularis var. angularis]
MMMEDLCFTMACGGENEACDEGDWSSRWSDSNSNLGFSVSNLGLSPIKARDLLKGDCDFDSDQPLLKEEALWNFYVFM